MHDGAACSLTDSDTRFISAWDGKKEVAALLPNVDAIETLSRRRKLLQTGDEVHAEITQLKEKLEVADEAMLDRELALDECRKTNEAPPPPIPEEERPDTLRRERDRLYRILEQIKEEATNCEMDFLRRLDGALQGADFFGKDDSDGRIPLEEFEEPLGPEFGSDNISMPMAGAIDGFLDEEESEPESHRSSEHSQDSTHTRQIKASSVYHLTRRRLEKVEGKFENRDATLAEAKRDWQRQREAGETSDNTETYDHWYLKEVQHMTQEFIDAETAFKAAERRMIELGVIEIDEFGAGLFSQASYGYTESVEEYICGHAPVEKIETWRARMVQENASGYQKALDRRGPNVKEHIELDKDDQQAIKKLGRASISISVLDENGHRRGVIKRWQEICAEQREGLKKGGS